LILKKYGSLYVLRSCECSINFGIVIFWNTCASNLLCFFLLLLRFCAMAFCQWAKHHGIPAAMHTRWTEHSVGKHTHKMNTAKYELSQRWLWMRAAYDAPCPISTATTTTTPFPQSPFCPISFAAPTMSTSAHGVLAFVLGLAGGLLVTLAVASGAPMALWCVHHPQCAFAIIVMHRTSQAQAPSFYPTPTGVYPSLCICLFLLHRVVGGPSGVPMYGKKNSYNVKVEIGEGENPDNAIRRFNRMFRNAGCAGRETNACAPPISH